MDANELFKESCTNDDMSLGIVVPRPLNAQLSLPNDFQIKTMADVRTLKEFVALNYASGIKLYRGHELCSYKIESTIVRLSNQKDKNCSVQDVIDAEKKAFNLFCNDVFKDDWLHNKTKKTDENLFKMSIGRHLGLPCRLIDVTASLENAIWFAVMNPQYYNSDGEVFLIVLNKDDAAEETQSPFGVTKKVGYAHEPFLANSINDLPIGEQRRFVQKGHFIWVGNDYLLNEQQVISETAYYINHYTIPWCAKLPLAISLYRDVYSGCAYQSEIANIKEGLK